WTWPYSSRRTTNHRILRRPWIVRLILGMLALADCRETGAPIRRQLAGREADLFTFGRCRRPVGMAALYQPILDEIAVLVVNWHTTAERLENRFHRNVITQDKPLGGPLVGRAHAFIALVLFQYRYDMSTERLRIGDIAGVPPPMFPAGIIRPHEQRVLRETCRTRDHLN